MNVYTFYEPLPKRKDDKALVKLWQRNWRKFGFNPVVLGLDGLVIGQHVQSRLESYPTINPPKYELLCYYRWLRYLLVTDDPLFCMDYDVFNNGFSLTDAKNLVPPICLARCCTPAVIFTQQYLRTFVDTILNKDPPIAKIKRRGHTSDMFILEHMHPPINDIMGNELPTTRPLVHLNTQRFGKNKVALVQEFSL